MHRAAEDNNSARSSACSHVELDNRNCDKPMRLFPIALLAALAAGGWYYWSHRPRDGRIETPAATPSVEASGSRDSTSHSPPPNPMTSTATTTRQRIVCPACLGEGQLMVIRRHAKVDRPYTCPLCVSAGAIERSVRAGAKLCPDCGGMAKRLYDPSTQRVIDLPPAESDLQTRLNASPCKRCYGTGLVKSAAP